MNHIMSGLSSLAVSAVLSSAAMGHAQAANVHCGPDGEGALQCTLDLGPLSVTSKGLPPTFLGGYYGLDIPQTAYYTTLDLRGAQIEPSVPGQVAFTIVPAPHEYVMRSGTLGYYDEANVYMSSLGFAAKPGYAFKGARVTLQGTVTLRDSSFGFLGGPTFNTNRHNDIFSFSYEITRDFNDPEAPVWGYLGRRFTSPQQAGWYKWTIDKITVRASVGSVPEPGGGSLVAGALGLGLLARIFAKRKAGWSST